MDNIIFNDPNEKDFLLFRLQLLIGAQLEDLQKHPESVKNSRPIRDTYIEVMRVISLLQNNPNIKLSDLEKIANAIDCSVVNLIDPSVNDEDLQKYCPFCGKKIR